MFIDDDRRKVNLATDSIEKGQIIFSNNNLSREFQNGCDYIFQLINDSFTLFKDGSYSTSIFLSITAIEEVSKIHIGLYRREGQTVLTKRREDLLFNHNAKHSIALQGTIKKGTRLTKAIGNVNFNKLLDLVKKGRLVKTRESALYSDTINGKFVTPAELFSKEDAKNILLLAIESWDDNLVGYDEHTYDICKKTDEIFNSLTNIDLYIQS